MSQVAIDEEPEVMECLVMPRGVIEINGRKYLAAPLLAIEGQRVGVAYYPDDKQAEASVYLDGEFYTEALPFLGRDEKFIPCWVRAQKQIIKEMNAHTCDCLMRDSEGYLRPCSWQLN